MAATPTVGVIGMRALQRDLAKLTDNTGLLYKALRQAGLTAAEPVAAVTRSTLPQSDRRGAIPGRLAGDVRVTASRSGAAVRMGRASLRYAGWVEFGGHRRAPHESSRDYSPRGRYLFPAALQMAPEAARLYAAATEKAVSDFPWTNTGSSVHD